MDFPKYNGNIHPDEWINDIKTYFNHSKCFDSSHSLIIAKSLVDSTIKLPVRIDNFEELSNALKGDVSFMVFKNANKRKLQSFKYVPEREGGDTSNFISNFRKLCYNAEINDIEEQKKYFYQSLPNNNRYMVLSELFRRRENINSMNDLIKEFEEIVADDSNDKANLIINGSIVILKHVATGKYLSSIENLCYTTGSKTQLVYAGNLDQNSLWKITFNKELADISVTLQHIKSNKFLGMYYYQNNYNDEFCYHEPPITKYTEVSCNGGYIKNWKFNHSKLEIHQGYLKSNDTINICVKKWGQNSSNNPDEFLRSHDIQFTIGDDTFQEVVCHSEKLGGNDEWFIELLKQA